jgi:hypothetical protein
VIKYFRKIYGIKLKLIALNATLNEKSETIANYVTQELKNHGLFVKCVAFLVTTRRINRSGNKDVSHDLKHELRKELIGVGCPAHIFGVCMLHGADALFVTMKCNT